MAATSLDDIFAQQGVDSGGASDIAVGHGNNQFLTFVLADEEYGVDILRVQEIRGWSPVTRVPNMPDYIKGVLNLRGSIVPIIDLRERFGLEALDYGPTTVVIVLRVESETRSRDMGVVVDGVSEVYSADDEAIKETPDFGTRVRAEFIRGLATLDEKMVILLDVDRLLNSDELAVVDDAAEQGGQD